MSGSDKRLRIWVTDDPALEAAHSPLVVVLTSYCAMSAWKPVQLAHFVSNRNIPHATLLKTASTLVQSRTQALHRALDDLAQQQQACSKVKEATQGCTQLLNQPAPDARSLLGSALSIQSSALELVDAHRDRVVHLHRQAGEAGERYGAATHAGGELDSLQDSFDSVLWTASSVDTIVRHVVSALAPDSCPAPVQTLDVAQDLQRETANIRAFCVEKFGVAPPVDIRAVKSDGHSAPLANMPAGWRVHLQAAIPDQVRYVYSELLKNALRAHIDRYGAAGVDDAPPISVELSHCPVAGAVCVTVADRGKGLPHMASPASSASVTRMPGPYTVFPYFASDAAKRAEPNYQYSREFGVPFSGHGTGLCRSRLYALRHGGGLTLLNTPGTGLTAHLWLDARGWRASDDISVLLSSRRIR